MQTESNRPKRENQKKSQGRRAKRKQGAKIPLIFLICSVAVVVFYSHIRQDLIKKEIEKKNLELIQIQEALDESVDNLNEIIDTERYSLTDNFVKEVARTEYGLLEKGEIRFEIEDVEKLFVSEPMPDWLRQRLEQRRKNREMGQ